MFLPVLYFIALFFCETAEKWPEPVNKEHVGNPEMRSGGGRRKVRPFCGFESQTVGLDCEIAREGSSWVTSAPLGAPGGSLSTVPLCWLCFLPSLALRAPLLVVGSPSPTACPQVPITGSAPGGAQLSRFLCGCLEA